jgi:homoserine O-succinyltransferase
MTGIEKFALGRGGPRDVIHVGLVNNMPDTAMRSTELQFAGMLKEAAGALDVRLHLFSLADIVRGDLARSRMEGFYADADTLPNAGIDALIVTGAEPKAGDLRDEPYWDAIAHLVDWAEIATISTLFSCLAAHAAVLHLDGIARHRLPGKLSGVFTAQRVGSDPLQTGMADVFPVPHSRYNNLVEAELTDAGYRILSRLSAGGVNSFARDMPGRSLFLFLQGHPEYNADTLGREYLRDTGRFLRRESAVRPAMPQNYFDRATENLLTALDAENVTDPQRYAQVVSAALPLQTWRSPNVKLFQTWLAMIAAEKIRRHAQRQPLAPRRLRA